VSLSRPVVNSHPRSAAPRRTPSQSYDSSYVNDCKVHIMAVSVCPIATIQAPIERVWFLLSEPTNYDLWWDATTSSINPEGHAHRGQKIYARTRGLSKWWDVNVMVGAVNDDTHELDLTTKLPLGITVHNHLNCAAVNSATTRVSFG
jgi:hypothetical protein